MFKVEKLIGCGSYGAVYQIVNSQGERFALKRIPRNLPILSPDMKISVQSDYIIQSLNTIITQNFMVNIIYPLAICDARIFFKSQRSLHEIAIFAHDALNGLNDLHKQYICHRDVRLDNFLVFKNETGLQFKLADLGIAKHQNSNNWTNHKYTPIECVFGHKYMIESDMYSFGIVLLKVLGIECKIRQEIDQIDIVKATQNQLFQYLCGTINPLHRELLRKRIDYKQEQFTLQQIEITPKTAIFYEIACFCLQLPSQRPSPEQLLNYLQNYIGQINTNRNPY